MLDESFCCGLCDSEIPQIGIDAIRALTALLDHHDSLVRSLDNARKENHKTNSHQPPQSMSSCTDASTTSASNSSAAMPRTAVGDVKECDHSGKKGPVS
jgi:hypothetical protein